MKKILIALSTAALCLGFSASGFAASHVGAAPMSAASGAASGAAPMAKSDTKSDTKAMKKKADADYKAAKDACKPMKGAEEKACMKQAKADHAKAEADIKAATAKK